MAVNDIFQLNVLQRLDSQDVLNVFHYVSIDGTHDQAADLIAAFNTDVLPDLRAMQSSALTYQQWTAFNLNDPTDFKVVNVVSATAGLVSGDYYPPFVAYGFLYVRKSRSERNGAKRIGGVPEAATTDGVNLVSGYITLAANASLAMAGELVVLGTPTFKPAIGHKPGPGHPDWAATKIDDVTFSHIGSQNTRKIGRGR
jgi:hypothetical protein